jgi:hypothetical protein
VIEVDERVWSTWRQRHDESYKARIELLLRCGVDNGQAAGRLRAAIARVLVEAEEADVPDGADEIRLGSWWVTTVPEGVLLVVGDKCDAFEALLSAVVEDLDASGMDGRLGLSRLARTAELPSRVALVQARLRVNGERVTRRRTGTRWAADRQALERTVAAGVQWCLEIPTRAGLTINADTEPALPVDPEDVLARLWELPGKWRVCTNLAADRFRRLVLASQEGRVTLIEGGETIQDNGWRASMQTFVGFVKAVSDDCVYGWVRGGDSPIAAQLDFLGEEPTDWPSQRLQRTYSGPEAFEDHLAPEAFGIQLLGPGYADRLPVQGQWTATQLSSDRTLLEHQNLEAWFSDQIRPSPSTNLSPSAELLTQARRDLTPLLMHTESERGSDDYCPAFYLPHQLATKASGFPTRLIGVWNVALILGDGRVIEDVELGDYARTVTRVGNDEELALPISEIKDVIDRETPPKARPSHPAVPRLDP